MAEVRNRERGGRGRGGGETYRKDPTGRPAPRALASLTLPAVEIAGLNRLLQQLAWDATIHHPRVSPTPSLHDRPPEERSASGQLPAFRFSGSHWSFLPTRKATVPSRLCSISAPGVVEVAEGGRARLAGVDPLLVMAQRRRDRGLGRLEALELGLGQQHPPAVVGQQHALLAVEQDAQPPLVQVQAGRRLRPLHAVVPDELDRRPVPRAGCSQVTISQRDTSRARPGRAPSASTVSGSQFQGPERQIDRRGCPCRPARRCRSPTSGARHGAVPQVAGLKGRQGAGPSQRSQWMFLGTGCVSCGRPPRASIRPHQTCALWTGADRARLDQLHHAAIVALRRGSACPSASTPCLCWPGIWRTTWASYTLWASGFSQYTFLPRFMAHCSPGRGPGRPCSRRRHPGPSGRPSSANRRRSWPWDTAWRPRPGCSRRCRTARDVLAGHSLMLAAPRLYTPTMPMFSFSLGERFAPSRARRPPRSRPRRVRTPSENLDDCNTGPWGYPLNVC